MTEEACVGVLTRCRAYTAKDLSEHYVKCGYRMSAKESRKIFDMVSRKYEHNKMVQTKEAQKRLVWLKRRREWETRGLYPESGQPLMERYVLEEQQGALLVGEK